MAWVSSSALAPPTPAPAAVRPRPPHSLQGAVSSSAPGPERERKMLLRRLVNIPQRPALMSKHL